MSDLIARLEALAGPDRDVDEAIACLIADPHPKHGKPIGMINARHYTVSVDAALTLVPEGWAWFVEWIGAPFLEGRARLWIPAQRTQKLKIENITCDAKNPAIALCVAALKARQAAEVQNV